MHLLKALIYFGAAGIVLIGLLSAIWLIICLVKKR